MGGKKITAFVPNDGCLNFVEEITRSWSADSDVRVTLLVIFPVSDSRSARSPTCPSTPSSAARRRGRAHRFPPLEFKIHILNTSALFVIHIQSLNDPPEL